MYLALKSVHKVESCVLCHLIKYQCVMDLDVGPPVPIGTSGNVIHPSLAMTGDSLCSSPCYSSAL